MATLEDYDSIKYFWDVKDDVRRWAGWKDFALAHPEFVEKVCQYERAVLMARLLMEHDIERLRP